MAETKDKVVTAESLKALHDYNKKTYAPMVDPEIMGDLSVTDGDVYANGIKLVETTATGMENLFASGATVLSPYQYGDELPAAGTVGRIFFKKLSE